MSGRSCLARAIDLLSRREHSQAEIRKKLISKGHDADEVDDIILRLVKEDILSDERYAESYVRQRVGKGYGPVRIRQELKQRDVSDYLITQSLSEYDAKWVEVVQRVYEKKYRCPPDDFKERGKRMNFLRYRGFSMDQISFILNQY